MCPGPLVACSMHRGHSYTHGVPPGCLLGRCRQQEAVELPQQFEPEGASWMGASNGSWLSRVYTPQARVASTTPQLARWVRAGREEVVGGAAVTGAVAAAAEGSSSTTTVTATMGAAAW